MTVELAPAKACATIKRRIAHCAARGVNSTDICSPMRCLARQSAEFRYEAQNALWEAVTLFLMKIGVNQVAINEDRLAARARHAPAAGAAGFARSRHRHSRSRRRWRPRPACFHAAANAPAPPADPGNRTAATCPARPR